ncbi:MULTISPECIES: response regulator [Devosia]|uniref:response regulator n=1 Tax=Devosia TaxID=46913 RepID=UPI001FE39A54|nr:MULTISPECIES: response regulator [Devosia]
MTSAGRRVLVVEDETLVLINLEDILEQLGWSIAAQAMRLPEAERLASSVEALDVAILDVNIGGAKVFPAAQILRERGVPILFATGYGRDGLPPEWQDHAVIAKPYSQADIERALDRLLGADV